MYVYTCTYNVLYTELSVEAEGGMTNCTPPLGCSRENSISTFSGFPSRTAAWEQELESWQRGRVLAESLEDEVYESAWKHGTATLSK